MGILGLVSGESCVLSGWLVHGGGQVIVAEQVMIR